MLCWSSCDLVFLGGSWSGCKCRRGRGKVDLRYGSCTATLALRNCAVDLAFLPYVQWMIGWKNAWLLHWSSCD